MAVIILPERDGGAHVSAPALADRVLDAAPEAVCHMVRVAGVGGVETSDAAAAAYLTSINTATGRERKG